MSTATEPFFEPDDRSMLPQAERDALQTAKPDLSREAWAFLAICAPDKAERLRRQQAAQCERESQNESRSRR
jgi:hypothetical protein